MITITPNAAEAVRTVVTKQKLPADTPLRVGITRDGCEGSGTQFRYVMASIPILPSPVTRSSESKESGLSWTRRACRIWKGSNSTCSRLPKGWHLHL